MSDVMIVEDQKMIRGILEGYILSIPSFNLVSVLDEASKAIEVCKQRPIDLILMDVQTANKEDGLVAVEKIKVCFPKIKIVVVTSLLDTGILDRAKRVKADSMWYKDCDGDMLIDIMKRTLAGEHIFPDTPPTVEIGTAKSSEFTRMELSVLRCLVKGMSYPEIAKKLNIEVTTVKYHVSNMLHKTNFKNKLQLALAVSEAKFVVDLTDDID